LEQGVQVIDRPQKYFRARAYGYGFTNMFYNQSKIMWRISLYYNQQTHCGPKFIDRSICQIHTTSQVLFTVSRNYHKLGSIIQDCFIPTNYKLGQRSQDLAPLYFENGLLYICQTKQILKGETE
jgi:hypothetical protein